MACVTAQHRQLLDQPPDIFTGHRGFNHHAVDTISQGKIGISKPELGMLAQASRDRRSAEHVDPA